MIDEWTDRTADLMCLADVRRWGVIKTIRSQSVAEHSFAVAVICIELMGRLDITDPNFANWVLEWALVHDGPEVLTGDIDGKFKRDNPELRDIITEAEERSFPWYRRYTVNITPQMNTIVKLADKIEAMTFIQQWGVGSRADDVYRELYAILWEEQVPRAARLLSLPLEDLATIVKHIMNHSVNEANCIQMRRHR